jgi:hypothetical protein
MMTNSSCFELMNSAVSVAILHELDEPVDLQYDGRGEQGTITRIGV